VAGARVLSALAGPVAAHPKVADFRHLGMIRAFEIATKRREFARWWFAEGRQRELLLRPRGNTLYRPPQNCLSDEQAALLAKRSLDSVALA
jgi:adenosylmethionine-8-amino-7-oxononanoate aminotransferase